MSVRVIDQRTACCGIRVSSHGWAAPETEFSAILRAHDLGIAIPSTDPTAIAAAIAGLQADPVAYARHRAAVLAHRAEYSTDAIPSAFATLAEETCASS